MDMSTTGKPINRKQPIPAHRQVRDHLIGLIQSGELGPGAKLPPEPELADQFGVARMTANKAILSLVNDGWLTRRAGRGTFVVDRRSNLKQCLVTFMPPSLVGAVEDFYFGTLYWNIVARMSRDLLPVIPVSLKDIPDSLGPETGIIAINPSETAIDKLLRLQQDGSALVVLGSTWKSQVVNVVDSDNMLGATLAVNHLADLGHREIAFVGCYPSDTNTQDRVRGFTTAMKGRGLRADESRILMSKHRDLGPVLEDQLMGLIQSGVTAVFAAGAHAAMHVLMRARQEGLSVPENLSVVGYDDPAFLALARPPMTTVAQPLGEMAALACDVLLGLAHAPSLAPSHRRLDPELVIRQSTACPG